MRDSKIGFLYALLASFCYAIMSIFAKLSLELPVSTLLFFRNFVGLLILTPIILKKREKYKVDRKGFLSLNIIFGFINTFCFYYAVKTLLLVDVITLSGITGNLFVPLVVYFWDRINISKIKIFACVIGFLGVIILLKPAFNCFNFVGLIALLGGVALAFSKVGLKKLSKTESVLTIIYYFFIGNAIISFAPMIIFWKTFTYSIVWGYVLLMSIFTLVFQFLQAKAYKESSATGVSVIFYSCIIFSGLFEWIIYKNIPDLYSIFGIFLIILGGFLVLREKTQSFDEKVEV